MTIEPKSGQARPTTRFRGWLAGAALAGAFLAGGIALSGVSMAADAMGHGMGHMQAEHTMMAEHLDKALDAAEATPDQKARIHDILKTAMQSIMPLHKQMEEAHGSLHRLLAAPTVDRAALEKLRADEVAQLDQASRTLVNALADAAEVLTPAQRAKLAEKMMAEHQH